MVARFLSEERGAALVEFSLVVMMMAVVVFGTINWARFFLLRGQLADAIRDAARYGATLQGTAADVTAVGLYARTLMANTSASSAAGTVTTTYAGTSVRVALAGFPFARMAGFGMGTDRTINVAAEFRREYP